MADPTPQPQPAPTPEPAPAPQPTPEPTRTFNQEDVDRIVQDRLARDRKERPSDDEIAQLRDKAMKLDDLEAANATELEKAQKTAADALAERDKTLAEAKETRLRAAIIAEAAKPDRKVVDPEAVVALLDRSSLELDDSGVPSNIAKAMDSLLEARPYLVVHDGGARGSADQGARGGGAKQLSTEEVLRMSPEDVAQAERDGRLASLLGQNT